MRWITLSTRKKSGELLDLYDVLDAIPDNDYVWHLIEFYGFGAAPEGMNISEFEQLVLRSEISYTFSWLELRQFARGLHQAIDCLLVANRGMIRKKYFFDELRGNLEEFVAYVIYVNDGEQWEVAVEEDEANTESVVATLVSL
ncbi:hypothetical protein [Amycolatopsis sacchari]|uniref:hypothetical protein n=1 Tax=Amycolatopsis sacchari TaxID=115433 RepID=UPI003EBB6FE9